MAYRASRGFVVRGGFGIYAADITHNEFTDMYNQAPFVRRAQLTRSLLTSQGVDVNSVYTFQNPSANASAAGADTALTTVGGFPERYPTQKAYTWNLTVEKDLVPRHGAAIQLSGQRDAQHVAFRARQRLRSRAD